MTLTLGGDGAVLATRDGMVRLPAPKIEAKSAVGAGDSFLGAMVWALADGRPVEDAFACGVAAGAATAMTPGTGLGQREDIEQLCASIGG